MEYYPIETKFSMVVGVSEQSVQDRARRPTLRFHFRFYTSELLLVHRSNLILVRSATFQLHPTRSWQPSRCHREPPLLLSYLPPECVSSLNFQQYFANRVVSPDRAASDEAGRQPFFYSRFSQGRRLGGVHVVKRFLAPKSSFGNALSSVLSSDYMLKANKHP